MRAEPLIGFLLDQGLIRLRYDQTLKEEMAEITPLGIEVNTILDKLKQDSAEAEATNQYAADKIE